MVGCKATQCSRCVAKRRLRKERVEQRPHQKNIEGRYERQLACIYTRDDILERPQNGWDVQQEFTDERTSFCLYITSKDHMGKTCPKKQDLKPDMMTRRHCLTDMMRGSKPKCSMKRTVSSGCTVFMKIRGRDRSNSLCCSSCNNRNHVYVPN